MKQIELFKRHCPDVVLTVLQMPVDGDCPQTFQIFCHGLRFIS